MKSVERQPKKEYDKPEVIETGGLFDKEGVKSAKIEDFIRIHFTDANSHFYLLTDAELGRIFNVSGRYPFLQTLFLNLRPAQLMDSSVSVA